MVVMTIPKRCPQTAQSNRLVWGRRWLRLAFFIGWKFLGAFECMGGVFTAKQRGGGGIVGGCVYMYFTAPQVSPCPNAPPLSPASTNPLALSTSANPPIFASLALFAPQYSQSKFLKSLQRVCTLHNVSCVYCMTCPDDLKN